MQFFTVVRLPSINWIWTLGLLVSIPFSLQGSLMVEEPMALLGSIDNAGSVFMGKYSPEPLGDYYAGPNHVLPTSGTARFFSPLSVDSFVKRSSFISFTREALAEASGDITVIAEREGLTAHANSIKVRF